MWDNDALSRLLINVSAQDEQQDLQDIVTA
jgi:hypothetical protein